jgi:hypothetical protein
MNNQAGWYGEVEDQVDRIGVSGVDQCPSFAEYSNRLMRIASNSAKFQ